jgi:NADH dehydrogenase
LIFITGASGFVGEHLVDYLLEKGHKVRCLVRSESAKKSLSAKGAEVIIGDVTQTETLNNILTPDDFVVHLVGIIEEKGDADLETVHCKGHPTLLQKQNARVSDIFYQSALGADRNSWSATLRQRQRQRTLLSKAV